VVGATSIEPLTAELLIERFGVERYLDLFAVDTLRADDDGTLRHAVIRFSGPGGNQRPSLALSSLVVAGLVNAKDGPAADVPAWIDYSARPVPAISWKDVNAAIERDPQAFRGRLIVVGATYFNSGDEHTAPTRFDPVSVPGVQVQLQIMNTILSRFPVKDAPKAGHIIPIALLCCAILTSGLGFPHRWWFAWVATFAICAYIIFAVQIFRSSRVILPVVGPLIALTLGATGTLTLRSCLPPYPVRKRESEDKYV
jgi:hypothetical protein